MDINKSQTDHVNSNSKRKLPYKYNFLIAFILISFILAFILGGFIIGKSKTSKQASETNINEQIKISANELPDSPANWQTFKIPTLNLEIKLPDKLSKDGSWEEQVIPATNKGSIICFSNIKSENAVCNGNILILGGTSTDFMEGRGGAFTDLQGFKKVNGKYFIKTTGGNSFELKNAKFKESKNANGIEILKVLGQNQIVEGNELPTSGTPGEGYIGAIVNTNNIKYPGIAIQLKLKSDISEYEFDQILESIKFKN